ncbi:MAG TPA: cytochrome c-type biogenesis protein [Burkholderiaceae bacterium]
MRKLLALSLLALLPLFALAGEAKPVGADPALEKHVQKLTSELRCLVCQNQTIADSHADLAIDLKNQVREKLAQGMSDQQVVDYMVERYGDFVLYRPPVKSTTWLLWFGPFLLLVLGLLFLAWKIKRRAAAFEAQSVSEADLQRAAELLSQQEDMKDPQ